ncbi:glycosyltransferase family 4 protein [uncultured Psychroserpens sp.]|uniref:glycosyltransferase family 4 protein n=1 Tax=uncultured Psychroserpens sp. TaxID=255436 RepID=UPI002638CE85|nr:glycosyltransferase family 4 protein [uncultured Psychroserpens sp.]
MSNKKQIVFISISSDLYGSSKLLLTLVLQLKKLSKEFHPIVCLPYEEGLLKDRLIRENIEIVEMPVLKLKREMLKSLKFQQFFKDYKMAKKILHAKLNGRKIHCVHSNTLATLFGSIYCFRRNTVHLFHIHEIMDTPWYIKYFFSLLQLIFANKIVYNSNATERFYTNTIGLLKKKSTMIFNGVERLRPFLNNAQVLQLKSELFKSNADDILIGLIGRFNRLKGHKLLLEAFKTIHLNHPNVKLCLVGSPPDGQEHFLHDIKDKIEKEGMTSNVVILPFQEDIYSIIDSLDIIVVPSTEPESFGIIAVEAMLSKRIVIASNLGGLADVIDHNVTGLLFEPNNKEELTKAISKVIEDADLKKDLERKAYLKAKEKFSSESMTRKFISVYNAIEQ